MTFYMAKTPIIAHYQFGPHNLILLLFQDFPDINLDPGEAARVFANAEAHRGEELTPEDLATGQVLEPSDFQHHLTPVSG